MKPAHFLINCIGDKHFISDGFSRICAERHRAAPVRSVIIRVDPLLQIEGSIIIGKNVVSRICAFQKENEEMDG
jgi:hypothetical protein